MSEKREISGNLDNYVVMSNDLIKSKSTLSMNEIKLLRIAIMQIVKEDQEFYTYRVKITELAKMLEIPSSNIYRDIDEMTTHLLQELVYIGDGNPKHPWKKFQWCSSCSYERGLLTIKLHDDLKPYLLGLTKLYTQYILNDILILKSVYSIRIYELIQQEMRYKRLVGSDPVVVYLSIETLRKATDTETKYKQIGHWKERVLDPALKEIREKLKYNTTVYSVKEGRKFIGYNLKIVSEIYCKAAPDSQQRMREAEEKARNLRKKRQCKTSENVVNEYSEDVL